MTGFKSNIIKTIHTCTKESKDIYMNILCKPLDIFVHTIRGKYN